MQLEKKGRERGIDDIGPYVETIADPKEELMEGKASVVVEAPEAPRQ